MSFGPRKNYRFAFLPERGGKPMVTDARGRSGAIEDMPKVEVKVGDWVGFKSDYEQSGRITKIEGSQLTLHNDNGFGGEYLRYAKTTVVDAGDCWID
jgi:hypothetical protein